MNFSKILKYSARYAPTVMMSLGIGGVFSTAILAVKATPKALEIIDYTDPQTKKEYIAATWKLYIPAVISCVITSACIIGSNKALLKRQAAISSLYAASEKALHLYQDKTLEVSGEKVKEKIETLLDKDKVDAAMVNEEPILVADLGHTIFFDSLSGRFFSSSIDRVKNAANLFNRDIMTGFLGTCSVNEWYYMLDIPTISLGDDYGWNTDYLLELEFKSMLTSQNTPCVVIDYPTPPTF